MIEITCHCGDNKQEAELRSGETPPSLALCHCRTCRHVTGQLFTSYQPIVEPTDPDWLSKTTEYRASDRDKRYFCRRCGCHLFRTLDGEFAVATGAIVSDTGSPLGAFTHHINTKDTVDGGLSVFLPNLPHASPEAAASGIIAPQDSSTPKPITATCNCGGVKLDITYADDGSRLPHSGLSDLIIPFHTGSDEIANKADVKWWLHSSRKGDSQARTKYLAGTCACASCRLISGFEIQSWAFIPRANIRIYPQGGRSPTPAPLDFDTVPATTLAAYSSSPGVVRNFCPTCGATVFWHDEYRPDLIDVSVGLLEGDGARVSDMLVWWGNRVSFKEEAATGRTGAARERAVRLVDALEKGIQAWDGEKASSDTIVP